MPANGYFDKTYIENDTVNAQAAAEILAENIANAPTNGVPGVVELKPVPSENWEKCYGISK